MFSAGRILRQNRRLSSLPPGAVVAVPRTTAPRTTEKRKFRCYLPFMWSALAMSFFGITVIVTGTAMCVAGWYLGHFGADDRLPTPVVSSPNATGGMGQAPSVFGVSVDMPPARGLAYAGPVVMSFGCFAVVFACVVVCETRDRVLETMDDRVRRGLPARPPGGIDADFYALVVEFRKRRMEKQRRRRKLLRCDDDDDDDDEPHVERQQPHVEYATSPLQPTPSTADFQSPSTINDFVEDHGDDAQPVPDQRLPTFRLEVSEMVSDTTYREGNEELETPWCSKSSFPDDHDCSRSVDVELRTMPQSTSPGSTHAGGQLLYNLSPVWKPTFASAHSCLSVGNDVYSTGAEPPQESATPPSLIASRTTADDHQSRVSTSELSFPLFAPISSLTQTQTPPYVRLEVGSVSPVSTSTTQQIHTASVHAIADRSPDLVPQPDMTSFEFPSTGFRHSCDATTSGSAVADAVPVPSSKWYSESCVDERSHLNRDVRCDAREAASNMNYTDNMRNLGRYEDVELSDQLQLEESYSSLLAGEDVVNQTKRRHCGLTTDCNQPRVAERLASGDDWASKYPQWSLRSADDGGPSRKRSRGCTGHPRRQVHSTPAPVDDDSMLLSRPTHFGFTGADCPRPSTTGASPRHIAGGSSRNQVPAADAIDSRPLYRPSADNGRNATCPQRRRPNGSRHLLTVHRRRRRPDRGDYTMLSAATPLQNYEPDADSGLAMARHSADELGRFISATSSMGENVRQSTQEDDRTIDVEHETSPLIWLRRRTTTTSSLERPYRRTSDPFQSTV